MTVDVPKPGLGLSSSGSRRDVLPTFVITLFTSALLLFVVQPLFTKLVLPRLDGTPAVWSVSLVFFQAMLCHGALVEHRPKVRNLTEI